MRFRILVALALTTLSLPLSGREALSHIQASRSTWYPIWEQYGVPPRVAEAVVYPEMLRYAHHAGRFDTMQTALVHSSYLGGGVFDLSIGWFQMKPSFAEQMEKEWMKSGLDADHKLCFDTGDSPEARDARMGRLREEKWQCIYLAIFLRLIYRSYGSFDADGERIRDGLDSMPEDEQVRLIAGAYNRGCRDFPAPGTGDLQRLRSAAEVKSFHLGLYRTVVREKYRYSDLSANWYRHLARE